MPSPTVKAACVQHATGHAESAGSTVSAILTSNITAHHNLVAVLGYYDPSGTYAGVIPQVTITDTIGNVWKLIRANHIPTAYGNPGNLAYYMYACPDCKATTSPNTVLATSLGTGNFLFGVMEFSPASGGNIQGPLFGVPSKNYYGGESYYGTYAISGDLFNNGVEANGGMGPWIWGGDPAFDYLGNPIIQFGQVYISFIIQRTDLVGPASSPAVRGSVDLTQQPSHLFQVTNASAGVGTLDVFVQYEEADYTQARSVIIFYLDVAQVAAIGAQFVFGNGYAFVDKPVENPHAYLLQGNGVVRYSGIYLLPQMVTLTQTQANVALYYNTGNGTQADPTTSDTLYTGAISVASTQTIKVLAHDPTGFYSDQVFSYQYTIQSSPFDGENNLCLETVDDATMLPEPSMNLAIQQVDNVLNGAFTYPVLDQTAVQLIDGYAPDVSQNLVLILTGALTHNVTIAFGDPNAATPANPTDTTHQQGRNPAGYACAQRAFVLINNTTGGFTITLEGAIGATPTYTTSAVGPKFLYMGGIYGIMEIV